MSDWKGEKNSGKDWNKADESKLKQMAKANTPTRVIGGLLGRSPGAVQNKASDLNVSLKPTNQRPNKGKGK